MTTLAAQPSAPAAVATPRRIAVIIVHYKTPGMLADCLATLMPQLDSARDEVLVVDNASGPEHLPALRDACRHHGATLIESDKNLGFAGANNLGLNTVRADFYCILNPDTLLRPNAVHTLLQFLNDHPDISLVGPRLEYPDSTPQLSAFGDPTPLSELVRGANFGPLTRLLKRYEVYGTIQNQPHRTDWLAGACVLMRASVLNDVGPLDDRFFMYFEEVDYFRRARQRGHAAWYLPEARVVHLVGQASGVTTDWAAKRLPAYWFESRHRYFRKHFGYLGMLAADAFWFTGHLLMRLRRLLTGVSHSAVARSETSDFVRHACRQALHFRTT